VRWNGPQEEYSERLYLRTACALRADQLALLAGLIFGDVARHRARSDRQRRSEIHLSRAATSGEVAVLGTNHDLIRTRGNTRSGIDASAATRLDDLRAGLLENFQITAPHRVLPRLLRSKL